MPSTRAAKRRLGYANVRMTRSKRAQTNSQSQQWHLGDFQVLASDSDDDDDIDHVMSKDEVAALKKDQGNVIPRAKRRAALASGIGDASALEAIQKAKPDSDEEAEFEF